MDMKTYKAEYYQKNKQKNLVGRKEYSKKHYAANKEVINEQHKAYNLKHRGRRNEITRKFRRTLKGRYSQAVWQSKRRKMDFRLTWEEFREIHEWGQCLYCEADLPEVGYGLDRTNNEPFYDATNSAPCCQRCNTTFMDNYSYEEKVRLGELIKQFDRERLSNAQPLLEHNLIV